MTPLSVAIVRLVLEVLEEQEALTRGSAEATTLRQTLLVRVERLLQRARWGIEDAEDDVP